MKKRSYRTFNYPNALPGSSTLLTGIRENAIDKNKVYISGFYEPNGDMSEIISFIYNNFKIL